MPMREKLASMILRTASESSINMIVGSSGPCANVSPLSMVYPSADEYGDAAIGGMTLSLSRNHAAAVFTCSLFSVELYSQKTLHGICLLSSQGQEQRFPGLLILGALDWRRHSRVDGLESGDQRALK
jgi:hypothetical protein